MRSRSGRDAQFLIDRFQADDFIHDLGCVIKLQPDVADVSLFTAVGRIVHFKNNLRPRWNFHGRTLREDQR
jgi:hypothetical protein